MSDVLGPLAYGDNEEEVFLGHSVARTQNMSEETAKMVDAEVRRFVEDAYAEAKRILTEEIDDLHAIAQALLEYETLSGDEIKAVMNGEKIVRPDEDDEPVKPAGKPISVPSTGKTKGGGASGSPEPQGA